MSNSSEPFDLAASLASTAERVNQVLDGVTAQSPLPGEIRRPARLVAAMRHALLAGGKRFRPFLVTECARLFGANDEQEGGLWRVAAAVECLHTYSLIHDDLPAMDDDDLRRGKPTVHRAFDEATAILAGDALLTLAFDMLAERQSHPDPAIRADLVGILARACGVGGMAGGQMLDLAAEGETPDADEVRTIQLMKTGALFAAACEMGALWAGADSNDRAALSSYGRMLGLAFQIADDLIDIHATPELAGKATGKDAGRGKATFVSVLGVDRAKELLRRSVADSESALTRFGDAAQGLVAASRFAASRNR
ncbi:MAG: polyprenyl synthetase family protein [Alphaproteobacteria bacterium]|nr:MAG: polyprenyl synthetase family protein [Alphaproteobacteria bacterium]